MKLMLTIIMILYKIKQSLPWHLSRQYTTTVTYSIPRDSSSSHSMVSRWLPVHMNKFDRSDPSSKSNTGNRQGLTSTKLNSSDHNSTLDSLNTTTLFSDLELLKTIIEKFDNKFDDVSKKLSWREKLACISFINCISLYFKTPLQNTTAREEGGEVL